MLAVNNFLFLLSYKSAHYSDMNYIDIVLGILLIISAIRGFHKGFIVEVASLLALVLGIWGAIHFSEFVGDYIVETFDYQPDYLNLISFMFTFVVIVIVVHILGNALEQIINVLALGLINHLAGLLFGILKTALILSIILIFFDKIDDNTKILSEDVKEESRVYEPIKSLVPTILPFLNFWDEYTPQLQNKTETEQA